MTVSGSVRAVLGIAGRAAGVLRPAARRSAAALLAVVLATATPVSHARSQGKYAKGLLWRVSKVRVAPSYVFGTIHLADPRVLALPDAVGRALAGCRRYYAETFQGEREVLRFFEAAQFEDGRSLESLIGAPAFAKAAAILRERRVPDDVISRLKPWAVLANLTAGPANYEQVTLDQKLMGLAQARNLRVLGLEGIEEQIAVFERIPLVTQIALLRHALDHRDELAAMLEPVIQAWMKRDLAGIRAANDRVTERYPEMAAHYRILFKLVVENRSVVMAHRLFMPLREGRAFVAVGANHLYGEHGILSLIERQGYRIERVY